MAKGDSHIKTSFGVDKVVKRLNNTMARTIKKIGAATLEHFKEQLSTHKSGNLYWIPEKPKKFLGEGEWFRYGDWPPTTGFRLHQASARYEWPALRYGYLRDSMEIKYSKQEIQQVYDYSQRSVIGGKVRYRKKQGQEFVNVYTATIGSNLEYAEEINAKRHFIRRGLKEMFPTIKAMTEKEFIKIK